MKAKIEQLEGLTSHADQAELLKWISSLKYQPSHIYLVHGEEGPARALQGRIKEIYGWNAKIAGHDEVIRFFADAVKNR